MDEDKDKDKAKVEEVSEEEKESDAEATAEVKEEELKSKLAEDFGIDPEDEPELFGKLLKDRKAQREILSKTIKQKINYREKLSKTTEKKPEVKPKEGESPQGEPFVLSEEAFNKKLDEREAKRDLENLDLPEDVENEVKDLAKVKGISIKEAAKLPYIASRLKEAEDEERIKSATPKRKGRGSYAPIVDPSKPLDPSDFDLGSKKGQKAWAEAKSARREYEKKQ